MKMLRMFLLLLIIECWWNEGEGCLEEEKSALLHLKLFLDPLEGEENSDCCQWERVECSNITGRVINLNLFGTRNMDLEKDYWYLNASLFNPFQQLESLDISNNNIGGCIENEGLERLSKLNNLKILDLSFNLFNNSILPSLDHLSSLKKLNLRNNKLKGRIDLKGLSKLEILHLSGNQLNHLNTLSSLNVLSSLKKLYLSDIGLQGSFDFQELDFFRNLEVLDISRNKIDNLVLSKELDFLSNLEVWDISYNEIDNLIVPKEYKGLRKLNTLRLNGVEIKDGSKLLQSLGSFPSLKILHLRANNFTKTAATTTEELRNFTNLEELILYGSHFHKSLLQSIVAFSSLKYLDMRGCNINGVIRGQDFPNFKNLEQFAMDSASVASNTNLLHIISESMTALKTLSMSSCDLSNNTILDQGICKLEHLQMFFIDRNDLRGSLPSCLVNMTSLRVLDASFNQLTGNLSSSSPSMYPTSIEKLILSHNQFQIPISLEPFFNLSNLKVFNGGYNQIFVESESNSLIPQFQLASLSLSGNGDGGTFPKFLYHQHELEKVDISHNNLSGEFPNWLLENNTRLVSLILVNNSLSGSLRMPIHFHKALKELDVSNNNLHGHVPVEIGDLLPNLILFNISNNSFNKSILSSFSDMRSLVVLDLSNNQLTGEISHHFVTGCLELLYLLLANNSLHGHLFSENFNLPKLRVLDMDGNHFTGEIPESLSNCSSLKGLYLSNNNLSGKIPQWLGNLSNLQHIILPNNHLEGVIPMEICQLGFLSILDICKNNISGSVPSCFNPPKIQQVHLSKNMLSGQLEEGILYNNTSLVTLDLSYNSLNGTIPNWVYKLPQLSHLILAHNNFEGEVSIQLCQLNQLQLIDLSNNNLFGHIPPCLDNTTIHAHYNHTYSSVVYLGSIYSSVIWSPKPFDETFEFTTKNIAYTYHGKPVRYMSGIDFACNKLIGEIPLQIGNLTKIQSLNLSNNDLNGSIPSTFSNLVQVESLDLSYNKLSGRIPPQLMMLHYLAVFSVAHNNLSGKIPEGTQFTTFNESSFEGNPLLCGLPLLSCNENGPSKPVSEEEGDNFMDMDSFYITFAISYVIVMLTIVSVLYVNPYWRRRWFYFVGM